MSLLQQFLDALGVRIEKPRSEQMQPRTLFDQMLTTQLRDQNRSKGNAPVVFNHIDLGRED